MSTTIEDRVVLVLRELTTKGQYGCWQRLADQTDVVAARWRKVYTEQQRPTPDIIQALCRFAPQYAFWIVTGITDVEHGHKAPESALPFPEWRAERVSDKAADEYFKTSVKALELLSLAANVDVTDSQARLDAFGCVSVRDHRQPNPVVNAAARKLRDDVDSILTPFRRWRAATRNVLVEDADATQRPD